MKDRFRSRTTIKQLINGTGQRVTTQRALLLELLRQRGGHLDADDLYRLAREKHRRISLSTVYRALRLFKKLGLVEELHFEDEHHHYEGKPRREHFHLVCLKCGRILEFESPLVARLKADMGQEKDFEVTAAEVHLNGYCSQCRQEREKQAQMATASSG